VATSPTGAGGWVFSSSILRPCARHVESLGSTGSAAWITSLGRWPSYFPTWNRAVGSAVCVSAASVRVLMSNEKCDRTNRRYFRKAPISSGSFQLAQARTLCWRGYTPRPPFLSSARARLRNLIWRLLSARETHPRHCVYLNQNGSWYRKHLRPRCQPGPGPPGVG
jgi:hypothetical protein